MIILKCHYQKKFIASNKLSTLFFEQWKNREEKTVTYLRCFFQGAPNPPYMYNSWIDSTLYLHIFRDSYILSYVYDLIKMECLAKVESHVLST